MDRGSNEKRNFKASINYAWRQLWGNKLSLLGLLIMISFFLIALLAPFIATHNPTEPNIRQSLLPPSKLHLMGTDALGMDIFSRVVWATRLDLYIAFTSVVGTFLVGTFIGSISGYFGGLLDEMIMRFIDSQQAFPAIVLGIAIAAILGPETNNVIIILVIVNYPLFVRIVRAQIISLRQSEFVEAAKSLGCSSLRIIFYHLLPNCIGPLLVLSSLNLGWSVLMAASLSFIGMGAQMPTPEWGLMIGRGARFMVTGQWWIAFFPGLAIFFFVLGANLLGDALQDILDPKKRFKK